MLCVECCLNALLSRTAAGVQLIGQRFREDLILDAMKQVETRTVGVSGHDVKVPPTHS